MKQWAKKAKKAVVHNDGVFMFLRAQMASQVASITDFTSTIISHYVFGVFYVYASFIGSVLGGVVNCLVNYKFTFRSKDVQKRHVALKYSFVWIGSIFLNTYGTYLGTELLREFPPLQSLLGQFVDDVFVGVKAIVSLIVGFVWNYNMQRYFVYRNITIKGIFNKKTSINKESKNIK